MEIQRCHRLLQGSLLQRRLVILPRIQLFRRRLIQRRILKIQTSKSEAVFNRACCEVTRTGAR